jgi:hypothetical protein
LDWIAIVISAAAIAIGVNLLFLNRRRGLVLTVGPEPDHRAWEMFATTNHLSLVPTPKNPRLSGAWHGVNISVEAKWYRADKGDELAERRGMPDIQKTWVMSTRFRAGIGAKLPEGLHLRRQSLVEAFADRLVAGGELILGDQEFDDAWLVYGKDKEELGKVLLDPRVRPAVMELLLGKGEVTVDETSIVIELPHYVSDWQELERYLGRIQAAVEAFRAVAPRTAEAVGHDKPADAPKYEKGLPPHKPTLTGLMTRAVAAGFTATRVGRDAVNEMIGRNVLVDIEVERTAPYHTRTGLHQGVTVVGLLTGGTSRVEVNFTGAGVDLAKQVLPGDRVIADAYVEQYEPLRNIAEVSSDSPPEVRRGEAKGAPSAATQLRPGLHGADAAASTATPAPTSSGTRLKPKPPTGSVSLEAAAPLVTAATGTSDIGVLLRALATGAAGRAVLLLEQQGREYDLQALVDVIEPTPPWRADPRLRDGRTVYALQDTTGQRVEVRLPPDRNAEIDALGQGGMLKVRVIVKAWDEVAAHAVLEALT